MEGAQQSGTTASKNSRRYSLVFYQDLSQSRLERIRNAFSIKSGFYNSLYASSWRLPGLVWRKESFLNFRFLEILPDFLFAFIGSKMELYPKIVKEFYLLTISSKRSILHIWQGFEYASGMSLRVKDGTSLYLIVFRSPTRSTT